MRARETRTPGGAGPPQHQAGGRGQAVAAPTQPSQTRHILYVASGNEHCARAHSFITHTYDKDTGAVVEGGALHTGTKVTKKTAFNAAVEVVNITKRPEKKPATLRGVPCFLEFSARTGQWRPHYGTAAINAMAFLGSRLPADTATAADTLSPSGYSGHAGFSIDDTYDYDNLTPEEAEAGHRAKDVESFQAARMQRDQALQSKHAGGAPNVDLTIREEASSLRGMTLEQLQVARR